MLFGMPQDHARANEADASPMHVLRVMFLVASAPPLAPRPPS
jgi:hypothetical protein